MGGGGLTLAARPVSPMRRWPRGSLPPDCSRRSVSTDGSGAVRGLSQVSVSTADARGSVRGPGWGWAQHAARAVRGGLPGLRLRGVALPRPVRSAGPSPLQGPRGVKPPECGLCFVLCVCVLCAVLVVWFVVCCIHCVYRVFCVVVVSSVLWSSAVCSVACLVWLRSVSYVAVGYVLRAVWFLVVSVVRVLCGKKHHAFIDTNEVLKSPLRTSLPSGDGSHRPRACSCLRTRPSVAAKHKAFSFPSLFFSLPPVSVGPARFLH